MIKITPSAINLGVLWLVILCFINFIFFNFHLSVKEGYRIGNIEYVTHNCVIYFKDRLQDKNFYILKIQDQKLCNRYKQNTSEIVLHYTTHHFSFDNFGEPTNIFVDSILG
jgi:hypothetical protein